MSSTLSLLARLGYDAPTDFPASAHAVSADKRMIDKTKLALWIDRLVMPESSPLPPFQPTPNARRLAMADDKREVAPSYEGFTLDELDEFGTMDTLPFPLDHDIWKDRRNRPLILAAMMEQRHG